VLLERRLRVGVDAVREIEDLATSGLDGGRDLGLEVAVRFGGAGGDAVGHGSSG
jgi:hypothetical protein